MTDSNSKTSSSVPPAANPLATEPISHLIRKYSIPTALTLMVNYLYNIADQIFVGQGVGITGMAATNVAFPLTIVTTALALMLGDGCSANLNLSLGRGEQDTADRTISHAVTLLVSTGVLLALFGSIFAPQIVRAFGATDTAFSAALDYTRIIVFGLPFLLFCTSFTSIIRADGNPAYSMRCMILGAIINLVLDPLFIFGFHAGVKGAAVATVIGQVVSGCCFLAYLPRLKSFHIKKNHLKPTAALTGRILKLGFPSFLTQIMTALVQVTMNNLMKTCGAASVYGSDIALSVYGASMKVYQIAHAMFVGVSSATQPINGFNYGAKNYGRVRETYRLASRIALLVSIGWFAVYQVFPTYIGRLFVSGEPLYLAACQHFFRLYMMAFFVYGIHMATSAFFQGIGQPTKALIIPLVRQGIVLIPLALLLSARFGLDGALLAVPVADLTSFVISVVLVKGEFSRWRKQGWL